LVIVSDAEGGIVDQQCDVNAVVHWFRAKW
jgi:hypothetical protein